MNEYIPSILNGITGIGVILVSILFNYRFPVSKQKAYLIGVLILIAGMSLVVWAAIYNKAAFLGEVKPRLEVLVQNGPYRFVRHPVYLGITLALVGLTITYRSWLGLVLTVLLFLPSEIYRARLEEKALLHKFKDEWRMYAARTGFFLPIIRTS